MEQTPVLIIGAGLSGLSLAYLLQKNQVPPIILEARQRSGGRIFTLYPEEGPSLEMGATWLGRKHRNLLALLEEMQLDIFEQPLGTRAVYEPMSLNPPQIVQLPPNQDPSYRIRGGSAALTDKLAQKLNGQIRLGQVVRSLEQRDDHIIVRTQDSAYLARRVVSTLPPRLLIQTVSMRPELPASLQNIAGQTHTWMGESIKVALTYSRPFWQEKSSATIISNVGPIPEMYEHNDPENQRFALKGFLNGAFHAAGRAERQKAVLQQLKRYYGSQAESFICYEEYVWRDEAFTFAPYDESVLPHQHNGHEVFRQPCWEGKLWLSGSETATSFPGYMDGAVESASWVLERLLALM